MRLLIFLILSSLLHSQEIPPEQPLIKDDGARVAALGYHWFTPNKPGKEMSLNTAKFREQMQAIKDANLTVISLPRFLAWRRGEADIPAQSILITIDDGWRSTYTEAFPILKEFKYPFTIFLYKNYVGANKGPRALTLKMIDEMLASGLCHLGSHSMSHHYPAVIKKIKKEDSAQYLKYLNTEFNDSKVFLESTFKDKVTTYAYPGGFHTPEMFPVADKLGYDNLFTVLPGKISRKSPKHTLPRYIVLGGHDASFTSALSFRNYSLSANNLNSLPFPVQPMPGETVTTRLPTIKIDLSSIENLDLSSIKLKVGGFGLVPHQTNPADQTFQWTVTRPLRQPACQISLQYQLTNKNTPEKPITWSFKVEKRATYRPKS